MNTSRETPFFFILGRPRSGTTLLSALFDAHPQVRIPPEFPIFLSLIQRFGRRKSWDEASILTFVDHIFSNNVFNHRTLENLKVDRERLTANLLATLPDTRLEDLLKVFNSSAFSLFTKEDIRLIGDKNPLYSIYIKRFLHTFPDARFVCITRDYRDNFISMKNLADLKLEAPVLTIQVSRWRFVARLFLRYKRRFPDRFFLVRYEELVENTEPTLREICRFLRLPYYEGMVDFHLKKEETLAAYPQDIVKRIHKNLMNPVNKSRMGLWKKELTPAQVLAADVVAGRYARLMGYEPQYPGFHPWTYIRTRPLAWYSSLLFRFMQFGSLLPYKISGWLSIKLLILVRTYHYLFLRRKEQPAGNDYQSAR